MSCRCDCGWPVHTDHQITVVCPMCKVDIHCTEGPLPPITYKPLPRNQWPAWATGLARYKVTGDIGVGDTAKRVFDLVGGAGFKWLTAKLGVPCGCTERQEAWNKRYPYHE